MFKLPQLNYAYDALADWVGEATMRAHHDHHHATYVDKLNAAVANLPIDIREKYFAPHEENGEISGHWLRPFLDDLTEGKLDREILAKDKQLLINQGGGHFNHALFWLMLTPKNDGEPTGDFAKKLAEKFGDFQHFTEEFEAAATGAFGSGWAWLTFANGDLQIETSRNQDLPRGKILTGLDLWEHAYYLDYKWNRADYVKAWWPHVDWARAARKFAEDSAQNSAK